MKIRTLFIVIAAALSIGCSEKEGLSSSPAPQDSTAQATPAPPTSIKKTDEPISTERAATTGNSDSSAGTSPPTARPASPYLSAESGLLADGGLSTEKAAAILQSDKGFEQTIRQFEQSAANSPEAQELTAHYKAAITRSLREKGAASSFSCGLSLCVGSVRSKSSDDYAAWSENFAKEKGAPTYSFADITQKLSDGEYESRFVFSTDPGANSISTAAKPRR